MTKHINHLLVAYVAGQVTPRQAAKVNLHTAVCPACREELARHQQIASDLKLTLGQNPLPREADIQRWWLSIDLTPAVAVNRPSLTNMLPVFLSLVLVLVFVVAGLNLNIAATPDTSFSPVLDTTLEPQQLVSESTTTSSGVQVIAQHHMVVTPVPTVSPMPVPSAPPSP